MKPFAQKQNQSNPRWMAFFVVVAAGFAVWFLDLVPELRPVPSGQLTEESLADTPDLPDSWDPIVDHTGEAVTEVADDLDPLLSTIDEEFAPLDSVLDDGNLLEELSEPDLSGQPTSDAAAANPFMTDNRIQPASFEPPDLTSDSTPPIPPKTDVVQAAAVRSAESVLSAETGATLRNVDTMLQQDRVVDAHYALSALYWKEPEQRAVFQRRLESTAAQIFTDPHRHFGEPYLVQPGDTLESIGATYNMPWQYLAMLNRLDPKDLQAGQELKVMKGPFEAIVDLSRFELTVHAHGYYVHRYSIGTGKSGSTPVGSFQVRERLENPVWYNPDGGQVAADDPQNPLGEYWIGLGDHIGIHGTIDPDSIGTNRSRGCIHMRDNDITEVFGLLGTGSTVVIRP